jgi:hypothetical protein
MADPEYLPAMCPTIQKACKDFPQIASVIIHHNGLHIEEFNSYQDKLAKDVWYRLQVQRELSQLESSIASNNNNNNNNNNKVSSGSTTSSGSSTTSRSSWD